MSQSLQTKVYSGFDELPESYLDVFRAGARLSFFLGREWFETFAQHNVGDGRLRIFGVESADGRALAALPMMQTPRSNGFLSPALCESLSNYYSCNFAPLLRSEENLDNVIGAIAAALWKDRRDWDVVRLQPLDSESGTYKSLVKGFWKMGMGVQTYFCFGNWYLDVAGRSYGQYVDSLSSVLRKNIPYNIRRLERCSGSKIVIFTDENGLSAALDDYEKVYSASWKQKEATPQFIRSMAHAAARNGSLRLGLIYIDAVPAAAQLWFVHEGVASIYKIAYDERFAKLSLGTILTAKLMERTIDVDGVKIVDYLSGEDEYKKIWMSHRREFWGIAAFNPRSAAGLMQIVSNIWGRSAKRTVEKLAGRNFEKLRWLTARHRAGSGELA
jgi:hypothetical protein